MRLDEETGVTYRQLDFWTKKGYLRCKAPGSGYAREFSSEEKRVAELMGHLVRAGITPKCASRYARNMLAKSSLVMTLGRGVYLKLDEELFSELVRTEPDHINTN